MASLPTREADRQAAIAYLTEAKAARAVHPERYPADFDWAIDVLEAAWREIERLQARPAMKLAERFEAERDEARDDLDQLRSRLRTLEWSAVPGPVPDARCCPACKVVRGRIGRHAPTCWLALACDLPRDVSLKVETLVEGW